MQWFEFLNQPSSIVLQLAELEAENTRLAGELLAGQQRADRELRQQHAEMSRLKEELEKERDERRRREEEEEGNKTPQAVAAQSPEPQIMPTAKPRKSLNGSGTGSPTNGSGGGEGIGQKTLEEMAKLQLDLDK